MKTILITLAVVIIVGLGGYLIYANFIAKDSNERADNNTEQTATSTVDAIDDEEEVDKTKTVIGTSAEGESITAYHYGEGEKELLFVGGIHGGYSWNTVLVAYELMDYLEANQNDLPDNVRVTVIPVMNPDGLKEVVGTSTRFSRTDVPTSAAATISGRFNSNEVDLNRNFDCEWQEEGTWQSRTVSGGSSAFSEPESQAVRDYVLGNKPAAAVVWYSAAGGVFASNCRQGVLQETRELTNLYAEASGYRPYAEFNFYDITGDMVNWLAKENVPAISVLLTNHTDVEWDKNRAGIEALLEFYAE